MIWHNPFCPHLQLVPWYCHHLQTLPKIYLFPHHNTHVDNFVGAAQQPQPQQHDIPIYPDLDNRRRVRRALLHSIDDVFQPLLPTDNPIRQEPVSLKKLCQGDCSWRTLKLILGWIIDTINMTIQLPPHCVEQLEEILALHPIHPASHEHQEMAFHSWRT